MGASRAMGTFKGDFPIKNLRKDLFSDNRVKERFAAMLQKWPKKVIFSMSLQRWGRFATFRDFRSLCEKALLLQGRRYGKRASIEGTERGKAKNPSSATHKTIELLFPCFTNFRFSAQVISFSRIPRFSLSIFIFAVAFSLIFAILFHLILHFRCLIFPALSSCTLPSFNPKGKPNETRQPVAHPRFIFTHPTSSGSSSTAYFTSLHTRCLLLHTTCVSGWRSRTSGRCPWLRPVPNCRPHLLPFPSMMPKKRTKSTTTWRT